MKVTEIGTKVKQKIRLVADHLKSNLTCPKYKFVLEMLAGNADIPISVYVVRFNRMVS